ncbi:MAG: hypothetical protein VKL58_04930 [Cyanobacteriota bacterium]|nr:hypothetical protein [Cyanobacteriota bacterium]
MRFLPPEEQAIVCRAQQLGLKSAWPSPAYLQPDLCTGVSLALAIPTYGYSLIVVPILWIIQHDQTERRLADLRRELETIASAAEDLTFEEGSRALNHGRRSAGPIANRGNHNR